MADPQFSDKEYEIKILLHKPKFKQGILALREKWSIPPEGFEDNPANNAWREQLGDSDTERLKQEINDLVRALGCSERWQQAFWLYLQTNKPGMLRVQSPGEIKLQFDGNPLDRKNVGSVWIKIDTDTTEREILEDFKYAKSLFNVVKKKRQPPEEFDRNIKILQRHIEGCSHAEIADWLNRSGEYKTIFGSDDVAKIIKRTKRLLE